MTWKLIVEYNYLKSISSYGFLFFISIIYLVNQPFLPYSPYSYNTILFLEAFILSFNSLSKNYEAIKSKKI